MENKKYSSFLMHAEMQYSNAFKSFSLNNIIKRNLNIIKINYNDILYLLCGAEQRIQKSTGTREPMNTSKKDMNGLLDVPVQSAILKTITIITVTVKDCPKICHMLYKML